MLVRKTWWRRHKVLSLLGLGAALLLAVMAGGSWLLYQRFDGNIRTDDAAARALDADHGSRPRPAPGKAQNILLLGLDNEAGAGSGRSDSTMLLHISEDRSRASMVSVPRDLMVNIPSCLRPDGSRTKAQYAQFNWAFQFGGAACAIRAFEGLSGVRVDDHLVVDFSGFKKVVDAIGGVEVTVAEPIRDSESSITLQPGRKLLRGQQALVFVRARLGVSDGSDLQRIERQKYFMRELMRKVQSGGVLANPTKLYRLLDAATSSLIASSGLDSIDELSSLMKSTRAIGASRTQMLSVPTVAHPDRRFRLAMVEDEGKELFRALREDRPLPEVYNAYENSSPYSSQ